MLKIYNTMSRKKEVFRSIQNKKVNMYVCGVTVYENCHIGHGRTFVFFDTVARYLQYLGYELNYVRNITDIEDKIIKRANKKKESYINLTARMITAMHKDFDNLNIMRPTNEPRVTYCMPEIIKIIKCLVNKGNAYIAKNGDVLFSVETNKFYGKLSCQQTQFLESRDYTLNDTKKNPLDFVLWKLSKPGEPKWSSPWGSGRPGWHIECSAITYKYFRKKIDIHGGGIDLIFPHHENEISQSTCAYGEYANTWMHTGMVMINQEKMSKSFGNSTAISNILKKYDYETVRYFLLSSHYRSQLNYKEDYLKRSQKALRRLYIALRDTNYHAIYSRNNETSMFENLFVGAMNDDFNTPKAQSVLFDMAHSINQLKNRDLKKANALASCMRKLGKILGFLNSDSHLFLQKVPFLEKNEKKRILALVEERIAARKVKNWRKADEIRNRLKKMNVLLEDDIKNTKWRRE